MNIQQSTLRLIRVRNNRLAPFRVCWVAASLLYLVAFSITLRASAEPDLLQAAFNDMYNLSFDAAHRAFGDFEHAHPDDPRGPVFNAAAYLFSEFDRLRILQSEFFVDDHNFETHKQLHADPKIKTSFDDSLKLADKLSAARLQKAPNDPDALFASAMSLGLRSDYTALIEKRNFQALNEVKDARQTAQTLLNHDPHYYDAYLALGVENYLLSQKPAPVRWLLHIGGAQTDKETGLANLRITATKGHYLQPYAQLLLAVAALRDKNTGEARHLLQDLSNRFPHNSLYREELKKIS